MLTYDMGTDIDQVTNQTGSAKREYLLCVLLLVFCDTKKFVNKRKNSCCTVPMLLTCSHTGKES